MVIEKKRIVELDLLRGILIGLIVLFHYLAKYPRNFNITHEVIIDFSFAKFAVNAFLILSGFSIMLSLRRERKKKIYFIFERCARLYPSYWCAIIITYNISKFLQLPNYNISLFDVLINFSMLQEFFRTPSVDGVYWFLRIELTFYFLMYIVYVFDKVKNIEKVCAWALVVSLLLHLLKSNYGGLASLIYTVFVVEYLYLFICGIVLYKIYNNEISSITLCLYIIIVIRILLIDLFQERVFTLVSILIFLLISNNTIIVRNSKLITFISSCSYALFLVHQNVGYSVMHYLMNNGFSFLTSSLFAINVSFCFSALITYYIEQPFQKMFKQLIYN